MAISLGGGGSASVINEVVYLNSTENLITLADGRVYLKGGVASTALATYPDATAAITYTGDSWSANHGSGSTPVGIAFDGTYYYVVDQSYAYVKKYSVNSSGNGVYTNIQWLTYNQMATPSSIVWDGTHLCILDSNNARNGVYKYTTTGTFVSSFLANANNTSNYATHNGITFDGTDYWIASDGFNRVYKYNQAGVYQNFSFDISGQEATVTGITWDGSYLYVIGQSNNSFMKYDRDGTFLGHLTSVYPQDSAITDICHDGTQFLMVGSTNKTVYRYDNSIGIGSNITSVAGVGQNYTRIK